MPRALIALGGNLGDVVGAFRQARACLAEQAGSIVQSSRLYKSVPLQCANAEKILMPVRAEPMDPDYHNAACLLKTHLTPQRLLLLLHSIEQTAGRRRTSRWAARELDLDLLAYDQLCIRTTHLTIPHPQLRQRDFVIYPLVDIAPDFSLPPDGVTPRQLKKQLSVRPNGLKVQALCW